MRARPRSSSGRWTLLAPETDRIDAEGFARRLLERWGVVFRDIVARETLAPPWRELLGALRRLEARGEIRGGRFVSGYVGEQFALPEAIEALRAARRSGDDSGVVEVSDYDPLRIATALMRGTDSQTIAPGGFLARRLTVGPRYVESSGLAYPPRPGSALRVHVPEGSRAG